MGNKKYTLKYTRKMPVGEVERMKSFKTNRMKVLTKTDKFKIVNVKDDGNTRIYSLLNGSIIKN